MHVGGSELSKSAHEASGDLSPLRLPPFVSSTVRTRTCAPVRVPCVSSCARARVLLCASN